MQFIAEIRLSIYIYLFIWRFSSLDSCLVHVLIRRDCHASLGENADRKRINMDIIIRTTARRLATTRAFHNRNPDGGRRLAYFLFRCAFCSTEFSLLCHRSTAACRSVQPNRVRSWTWPRRRGMGEIWRRAHPVTTPHPRTEPGRGKQHRDQTRAC